MTGQIEKEFPTKTGCWLCGQPAHIFSWFEDDDRRKKAKAKVAACCSGHAADYFNKLNKINGGVK